MRALVFHFSSLVGLLVLLDRLWNAADIERTLFMAFGTGLAMYVALMMSYVMVHRVLSFVPESPADVAKSASKSGARPAGAQVASRADHAESPVP